MPHPKNKPVSKKACPIARKCRMLFLISIYLAFFSITANAQVKNLAVSASNIKLVKTIKINAGRAESAINDVDPDALYSNITSFAAVATKNGSAAVLGGNTITTLLADSLGLVGTPPFSIGAFTFSVANFDASEVLARPLIRFYLPDGALGGPGTLLASYSFDPIPFASGNIGLFTGTVTPFTVTTHSIWAGVFFDNDTAATGATLSQLNNLGQGVFDPIDRGTSTDGFFATDEPSDFQTDNPVGAVFNFGGPPAANFGWEIISSVTLPLTLKDFKAQANGLTNRLTWNTTQELNSRYFRVEHSTNGIDFTQIGTVKAFGNSNVSRNYQFDDASPARGINYYRLRSVDLDNSGKYSKIVAVKNSRSAGFSIYPNPVKSNMIVDLDAERAGVADVKIIDMSGRTVYKRQITVTQGSNNFPINAANFSKGTYSIEIQLNNNSYTSKFSKL